MIAWLLFIACSGESTKAHSADTGADDPCPGEDESTGAVVGEVDCDEDGLCLVAEGVFWRGADDPTSPEECPVRQVALTTFRIDRFEVTQSAYAECVSAGVCEEPPAGCVGEDEGDLYPAICVAWDDAVTYCEWRGGRLPTEAEWEKAARGADGATWAWGSTPPDCNSANFRYVAAYCNQSVIDVGSYEGVSAYGLADTVGNAWEWTQDWYDASWYAQAAETDPVGPESDCHEVVDGPAGECLFRVIRGGAYNTSEKTTRGSARSLAKPAVTDNNIGFRCAYDS